MDRLKLKQRVVGALVLLSLAVIFLPLLFDKEAEPFEPEEQWLPPAPEVEAFGNYEPEPVAWEKPEEQELWDEQDVVEETPEVMPPPPVPDEELPSEPALTPESLPEAWAVQLATFSKRQNAENLSIRLQKSGYQAYVREIQSAKGPMTRVFVGPELVATEAKALRTKLSQEFKLDGIVVRFNP